MENYIYVIAGKDQAMVGAQYTQLLDELIAPDKRMMGLSVYDGDQADIAEVLDELRTLPFLSDVRVVAVKNAAKFITKNRPLLETYFEKPCQSSVLVLTADSWPANTRLAKMLQKVGQAIKVQTPSWQQIPYRIIDYANEAHDKKLSRDAADLLIELIGDNLVGLYCQIDKLAIYTGDKKVIALEHVEQLIGHHRIFGVFEVIDSITAGNLGKALERLRNMFAEDKNSQYTVVGAFAYHFRRMFTAKQLLDKGENPGQVAGRLRIWNNKDRFFAQLRKLSLEQIGTYLQQLATSDHAIKTGQIKPPIAMEQMLIKMATV